MNLSVVTTLYCSEAYIDEFYRRIVDTANVLTTDYEIIFVSDGSPDASLQHALALVERDSRVKVVELSRNFGHHKAMLAGLSVAKGDRVFLLDVDLEEQPELLLQFWQEMDSCHVDVVFGVQKKRTGSLLARLSGNLFYHIFNLLSDTKIPMNLCTVRLLSRNYVQGLLSLKEQNVFLAGNANWIGFKQMQVPIEKKSNNKTSYSFRKRLELLSEAVTSFSSSPLWVSLIVGSVISLVSGGWGVMYLITEQGRRVAEVPSHFALLVSVWFLGGLILFFVGLNGIYISKIVTEVKGRPQFIVRYIHEKKMIHMVNNNV